MAQPYLRTSTDDKGQRPERQLVKVQAWAVANKVRLLVAVVDDGASASNDDPLTRDNFVRACELGEKNGATALVLEEPDRLTRLTSHVFGWTHHEVAKRYGLKIWYTDQPLEMQDQMIGRIMSTVKAEQGHESNLLQRKRIREGMDLASKKGTKTGRPIGRPRKMFTPQEMATMRVWRDTNGWGYHRIARALNEQRGAYKLNSKARRVAKEVSWQTVRRAMMQPKDYVAGKKNTRRPKSGS